MRRGFAPIVAISIVAAFLIGIGATVAYFKLQPKLTLNPQTQSSPVVSKSPQPSPSPDETVYTDEGSANWKTYRNKTLGIEFKLPPSLSKYGELKEEIYPGETGSKLCITFSGKPNTDSCYIVHFNVGTTSIDYSQGRGGEFMDLQGFKIENGKYVAKFVNNNNLPIPQELVTTIKSQNGIEILKIKGRSLQDTADPWNYDENGIGALINITSPTFRGFAIFLDLKEGTTEKEFDQILSTFKFL